MAVPTEEENTYGLIEQALQAARSGNCALSEQLLLRSYGLLETELIHNAELRGRVFHLLANNYRDRGKLGVSHEFYDKACDVLKKESHLSMPLSLYDDMYIQALSESDYDLALRSQIDLNKVLSSGQYSSNKQLLKNLLRLVAVYWVKRNYSNAEMFLNQYVQFSEDSYKLNAGQNASLKAILGLFAFRLDRPAQAESLYLEALENEQLGVQEKAETLNQLGFVRCSLGKIEEARPGCKEAINLREKSLCNNDTASEFRYIADVYCQRDCQDEASNYCRAALETYEMGRLDKADENSLALILRRLGLLDDAAIIDMRRNASLA